MSHVHMPIASKSLNLPHKHVVESAKHAHNQTCLRLSYDAKLTFVCTGISLALTTRMDGQAEGRKEGTPLARVRKLFLYVTPLRRDGILPLCRHRRRRTKRERGSCRHRRRIRLDRSLLTAALPCLPARGTWLTRARWRASESSIMCILRVHVAAPASNGKSRSHYHLHWWRQNRH